MKLGFITAVALLAWVCLVEAHPEWTTWALASKSCTDKKACDDFKERYKRRCNGGGCSGPRVKYEECEDLPPCAVWGEWIAKGKCSAKCGDGQQLYKRKCIRRKYGKKYRCTGASMEMRPCNWGRCGTWGEWQDGECSTTCGAGQMTQTRNCQYGIGKCVGEDEQTTSCNNGACDVEIAGECDGGVGAKGIIIEGIPNQMNIDWCLWPRYEEALTADDFNSRATDGTNNACTEGLAFITYRDAQLKVMEYLRKKMNRESLSLFLGGKYVLGSGNTLMWNSGLKTKHSQEEFYPGFPKELAKTRQHWAVLTVKAAEGSLEQGLELRYSTDTADGALCMTNMGKRKGPLCEGDTCARGATLHLGQKITSMNGRYSLEMQTDGNLVLFCNAGNKPNWASDTNQLNVVGGLQFQASDGNLVLRGPGDTVHWTIHKYNEDAQKLVLQNDGNLVLYTDTQSVDTWIWKSATSGKCGGHAAGLGYGKGGYYPHQYAPLPKCSGDTCPRGATLRFGEKLTSKNGKYTLSMQSDGNLVLLCGAKPEVNWATDTNQESIHEGLAFQDDGNLVLLGTDSKVRWTINKYGVGGAALVLQDDGNLLVFKAGEQNGNTWIWKTGTDGQCGGHKASTGYGKPGTAYPGTFYNN